MLGRRGLRPVAPSVALRAGFRPWPWRSGSGGSRFVGLAWALPGSSSSPSWRGTSAIASRGALGLVVFVHWVGVGAETTFVSVLARDGTKLVALAAVLVTTGAAAAWSRSRTGTWLESVSSSLASPDSTPVSCPESGGASDLDDHGGPRLGGLAA